MQFLKHWDVCPLKSISPNIPLSLSTLSRLKNTNLEDELHGVAGAEGAHGAPVPAHHDQRVLLLGAPGAGAEVVAVEDDVVVVSEAQPRVEVEADVPRLARFAPHQVHREVVAGLTFSVNVSTKLRESSRRPAQTRVFS